MIFLFPITGFKYPIKRAPVRTTAAIASQNGMAYEAEGGIYFDVERMGSEYGKLGVRGSESTTPETEGGSDLRGKRSRRDFALWKRARPNEPW